MLAGLELGLGGNPGPPGGMVPDPSGLARQREGDRTDRPRGYRRPVAGIARRLCLRQCGSVVRSHEHEGGPIREEALRKTLAQHRDTPTERVARAYAAIADVQRAELWTCLRPAEEALGDASALAECVAAGEELPLAGLTLAVKDNIDVAGLPTTAGCPGFAYRPQSSAPAVARLIGAGAIVLGKTNLDQFATGLVGTRSPHGAVRDARRPEYVSGGSTSGSAVAVALGIADIGLGTDTAGSIRVPAAFQGLVGVKPTIGLVSTRGVVPANRSLDCVGVLTRELDLGRQVLALLAQEPPRAWPLDAPLAAPPRARIGVPDALPQLSDEACERYGAAVERLRAAGHELVEFELEPFLETGRMLYAGAFMAERYAAVGAYISHHPSKVNATVSSIILSAGSIPAYAWVADIERLEGFRDQARAAMAGLDALLMPTTLRQPSIAEVEADPIDANMPLGLYSTCANLLDMCAVAVPAGEADGGQFGVTLLGRAFADGLVGDLAADLLGQPRAASPLSCAPSVALWVTGEYRRGEALNAQLTGRGGALLSETSTAAGTAGELWVLPPGCLAEFVGGLPAPMAVGPLALADGREVTGIVATGEAALSEPAPRRPASDQAPGARPG
jgi:allophanate hydrolase